MILAFVAALALPQAPSRLLPLDTVRIDSIVRAHMAAHRMVGASVGILQDGRATIRSYGDAVQARGVPVDSLTRFAIGSVTKEFTCAIIVQLAAEGRLSLDDKVEQYFASMRLTRAADITLRDLMGHVSGYADYYPLDFVDRRMAAPIATDSVIRWYAHQPLDFEPVTRWSYSNTGFLMLSRIAEMVTRRPFATLLQQRIFGPLGMRHTTYDPRARGAGYAQGYASFALGAPAPVDLEAPGWLGGAGGIFSTASDMLRWDQALMAGRVVGGEWLRQMTTERRLQNGAGTSYGLGLFVHTVEGDTAWSHGGAVSGFRAQNVMIPAAGAAVVVLSNSEEIPDAFALLRQVVTLLPARPRTDSAAPRPPAARIPDIAGPAAADQARALLRQMQAGVMDRAKLSEEFNAWLTDAKVREAMPRIAALGEPTRVEPVYRGERGGMEVTVTRFVFANARVGALMYRMPSGEVQQFLLLPQ